MQVSGTLEQVASRIAQHLSPLPLTLTRFLVCTDETQQDAPTIMLPFREDDVLRLMLIAG